MMYGRRAFSRVFEITESSEIGRKDVPVLRATVMTSSSSSLIGDGGGGLLRTLA